MTSPATGRQSLVQLRDYQRELLERVETLLNDPADRVMMQLPTGGGKTCIAGELLSRWLSNGRKAVWLTHRRELAAQTEAMLSEHGVAATCNMQWDPRATAPVLPNGVAILMAQTVSRHTAQPTIWEAYTTNDLMIIDEAHHATARGWARAIEQWPGPALGVTATPWRLSKREGFDHLFQQLISGPQVAELQSKKWLCPVRALSPPDGQRIVGGLLDGTGDYNEAGIEEANRHHPDVMTAGALGFWQEHGQGRPTIIYAVSVRHARNLAAVFKNAGIPAEVMLGDTPDEERAKFIVQFKNGEVKALINVLVATEGFDLPDAACVIMARPTMSLSLYLQMAGRGMRPKPDGGDCVVLDLAGNSLLHGLPEQNREWSLKPRGEELPGVAPTVQCEFCNAVSPAAAHRCPNCDAPFGEDCARCGAWRPWKRWSATEICEDDHDLVCDLCHYDAHIMAELPVTQELLELSMYQEDDELSPHRDPFLKNFLEEELTRFTGYSGGRKADLRNRIARRETELQDDIVMLELFHAYLDSLDPEQRPPNELQKGFMSKEWYDQYQAELGQWRKELAGLESQTIDGQQVFNNARDRLVRLLRLEAIDAGLIAPTPSVPPSVPADDPSVPQDTPGSGWVALSSFHPNTGDQAPSAIKFADGSEHSISAWSRLVERTAAWLWSSGKLTLDDVPLASSNSRYIVNTEPVHPNGRRFHTPRKVSGTPLVMEANIDCKATASRIKKLLTRCGEDSTRTFVKI